MKKLLMYLFLATAVVVPTALIMVLELYSYRVSGVLVLQGRSFLMLLIPLVVVLIRGWQRLLPRPANPGLGPVVVLLAILLNVLSLAVMINAFYG